MSADYYQALDLVHNATQAEIKAQYRRLARECHPDVSSGASSAERFKEITAAYETLSDEAKRADYDKTLQERYGQSKQSIPNPNFFSSPLWGDLRTAAFHFATDIIDHLGTEDEKSGYNAASLVAETTTLHTRTTTSGGLNISLTLSGSDLSIVTQQLTQGLPLDDYASEIGDIVSQKLVESILNQFRYSSL